MKRFAARRRLELAQSLYDKARGHDLASGGFASAENSRDAHSWLTSRLSPDSALEEAREDMILRSESAYKNNELATGFVEGRVARIPGCGMRVDPSILAVEGEITESQADDWNDTLRENFEITCTRIGKHREHLWQIQHQCQRHFDRHGEFFVLIGDRRDPLAPTTLKIETIHPKRVETPPGKEGDPPVRMGIQLDASGVAIGAWVRDVHPNDTLEFSEKYTYYPFESRNGLPRLLHVFDKIEDGQHRGFPRMQVGTRRLKNSDEYNDAELERNWAASCLTAIVRSELDIEDAMTAHGAVDADGQKQRELSPGQFSYVGPADDVTLMNPNGPQNTFEQFQNYQGRMFGAGLSTPYELISGDWRGVTYSAGKIIVNGDEAITSIGQMFHAILVTAVWQNFVTRAVTSGLISVDQVAYRSNPWPYWRCRIIPTKRMSIDPAREKRTELLDVEIGAVPVQEYIERTTGKPAREVLKAAERGRELLREHGFDEHMPQMGRDVQQQNGGRTPDQPGDVNPESSEANAERQPA